MASLSLRTLLVLVTASAAPVLAQAPTEARRDSLYQVHKGDFDYLLGEWKFTSVSKEWGEGQGYWTAVRLGDGADILDEYRVVGDSGETYVLLHTLRAYNASLDQWELVSSDNTTGLKDAGSGQRAGAEMHITQMFGVSTAQSDDLAHPILRHHAGSLLLACRYLEGRREDLGDGLPPYRGPAHRAAADTPPAHAGLAGAFELRRLSFRRTPLAAAPVASPRFPGSARAGTRRPRIATRAASTNAGCDADTTRSDPGSAWPAASMTYSSSTYPCNAGSLQLCRVPGRRL